MRSDHREWKSSASVCVATMVPTSLEESEDRLWRVFCVLPHVVAPGRDWHEPSTPKQPLCPKEWVLVFRVLGAIVLLLVQDVCLSRCSSASLGALFSFEQTDTKRQSIRPFSIFTLLLNLS